MKKFSGKRALSALLALCLVVSMAAVPVSAAAPVAAPDGKVIIEQTHYQLARGVTETDVFLNEPNGSGQIAGCLLTVEPGASASFRASYGGYYAAGSTPDSRKASAEDLSWMLQSTTAQARAYETATGGTVLAATNGDYYNMQTARPLGYLIMEGNAVQTGGEPYFAVLNDGSYAIREAGEDCSDVAEAISGPFFLLRHGAIMVGADSTDKMPRNSIGMKADGTVVTFLADGRQYPYSVGMSLYDLAEFLLAQGVEDAIYLDGGGSATFATRREGTQELAIRNRPSDGQERTVSSALLLVSTAEVDGAFDHASLSPNNQLFTPGSAVQFTAAGVDAAGGPAELPADAQWTLADSACGTIDETGLFTPADGYRGDVTVSLVSGGETAGTTTVTIADVTELGFSGSAVSLDFGQASDLGLTVKSNGRAISYKDGDFAWTVTPDAGSAELGTVAGNLFTAAGGTQTMTGTVTATYVYDETLTASIHVEIGKLPVVLMDFEPDENGPLKCAHYHWGQSNFIANGTNTDGGYIGNVSPITVCTGNRYSDNPQYAEVSAPYCFSHYINGSVPAADIFKANGYSFFLWPNSSITGYEAGNLQTTTDEYGSPVRFDDYSLELNYDYESYNVVGNSNYYVRYSGEPIQIEGSPNEIGVWVYVPEGTWSGYALYLDLWVWDGSTYVFKNYPLNHPKDGDTANRVDTNLSSKTDWTGWQYCFADISKDIATYQNPEHPVSIMPGTGIFWLSYQPGGDAELKGRKNGSIFFDNLRVVYGTNLDDLDNPRIGDLSVNGAALADDGSTVVTENAVELRAVYSDVDGANCSGINAAGTRVEIDGAEIENADRAADSATVRLSLPNGHHVLTVSVQDNFGNETKKSVGFTVDTGKADETQTVSVQGEDFVPLGGKYELRVVATERIAEATLTLSGLNADIGEPTVTYAAGWTGTAEYRQTGYKKAALTLHLTPDANAISTYSLDDLLTETLATVTFSISRDLDTTVNSFTYTAGNITYTDLGGNSGTSALVSVRLPLSAYYVISADPALAGRGSWTVRVKPKNGEAAPGAAVALDGTAIGTTDENGEIETNALGTLTAGSTVTLTATGPDGVAEALRVTVLSGALTGGEKFTAVQQNAGEDASTTIHLSWLADPTTAEKAVVHYRAADGDWQTADGTCSLTAFATSGQAAYVCAAVLTGLAPGTKYEVEIGDGTDFISAGTYSTAAEKPDTTAFFVMGDTQMNGDSASDAGPLAILQKLGGLLEDKQVDFALQTGDYVDNGGNFAMWREIQQAFDEYFPAVPYIHTLGNHEYYGDITGANASAILQLPEPDYYSLVYGNVYVAVINNTADLDAACAWLVDDAAKADCAWKVLSIHQPPYFTNKNGGSDRFHATIPAAADAAGIDVVFSGHDHSYARTAELRGGEKVDAGGTVYFICGDLGEKSRNINYAITSDFSYEYASQDYEGLMLYVSATDTEMTISAYDSNGGAMVDSVRLRSRCASGHEYTTYDSGMAVCARCGHKERPEDIGYTGYLTVRGTSDRMYFISGRYQTGWFTIGETTYHFSPEGIEHATETVDTRTCTASGALVTTCLVCGASQRSQTLWAEGHDWDDAHVCRKCGFHGIDIALAEFEVFSATMDDPRAAVRLTYDGTRLRVRSSQVETDGYVTYANNSAVGYGTVTVRGCGDYYGEVSKPYKINPSNVSAITAESVGRTDAALSWSASRGATNYRLELKKAGGEWTCYALVGENTAHVTGLEPGAQYSFRVYGYTKLGDEYFSAPRYSPELALTTLGADAPESEALIASIAADAPGGVVRVQKVDGQWCLFLPSGTDAGALRLTVRLTEEAAGRSITVSGTASQAELSDGEPGSVDLTALGGASGNAQIVLVNVGGAQGMALKIVRTSGVAALHLTSDDPAGAGRGFVDASRDNRAAGAMTLTTAAGEAAWSGALTQIKARGNTTFTNAPKKSYQIKLAQKADLLGAGERGKTWVLLAGYFDATLLHDKTFKDLAADIGMPYTAGCEWVDLYYDGEYRGVYLLGEKNAVGASGVDITDLEKAYEALNPAYGEDMETAAAENRLGGTYQFTTGLAEPDDLTGGYLLELNGASIDEASGFTTAQGANFNVKSPEWCGQAAMAYISEYYQEFESAVYAVDGEGNYTGYNEQTGKYYYDYCDLTSLVQVYLMAEFSGNVDSFYSSLFFYKDAGGKLYAGPVWDMELTCGSGWTGRVDPDIEFVNGRYLASALCRIPGFRQAVQEYYQSTFRPAAVSRIAAAGENAAVLASSARMNYMLWPYVRVGSASKDGHLWEDGTTYADVVTDMTSWMRARLGALDGRYGTGGAVDPTDPSGPAIPTEPDEPVVPVDPVGPDKPDQPVQPNPGPVSPATPEQKPTAAFDDVPEGSYCYAAVSWAAGEGITTGVTDTLFAPNRPCTRAQLTVMLYRAAGSPSVDGLTCPFADVRPGDYCYDAVRWAANAGIVRGTTDETFSPNAVITRAQAAALLHRMQGAPEPDGPSGFADVPDGAYYAKAVAWAKQAGVVLGKTDTRFAPGDACTRGQIVTYLYRLMAGS